MKEWELRPARDHGLSRGERVRSLAREPGLGTRATAATWRGLIRALLFGAYGLAIEGREHLPAAPPFVMVGNHTSHFDALALGAALPGRLAGRAFALAAGDTFFTNEAAATFAAYAINALPIWRKRTTGAHLAQLRERLIEDRSVMILFPEGTRSRTGEMGRFKPGIGALVAGTTVPVVPCYLEGAAAAWPPTRRWPGPGRLRLCIGPALLFETLAADHAGMMAAAEACEAAVRRLGVRVG